MQLDIYFSYACRESYLVYAWLDLVQKSGQLLEIHWHPFAIQMDDPIQYWKRSWTTANSELRGFIAAETAKRQGGLAFHRFHDALERTVHENFLELGDETTLTLAAQEADLDVDRFQTEWHNPELVQTVQRNHVEGVEELNISGTPTLVFPNRFSLHLELSEIPPEQDALDFFCTVESLALKLPYIRQLRQFNRYK